MPETAFVIGDTVSLKCGSRRMVINREHDFNGTLLCCWHDDYGDPHAVWYDPAALTKDAV